MAVDLATQAQIQISVVVDNLQQIENLRSALNGLHDMGRGAAQALQDFTPDFSSAEKEAQQTAADVAQAMSKVNQAYQQGGEQAAQVVAESLSKAVTLSIGLYDQLEMAATQTHDQLRAMWSGADSKAAIQFGQQLLEALGVSPQEASQIAQS